MKKESWHKPIDIQSKGNGLTSGQVEGVKGYHSQGNEAYYYY